MNQAQQRFLTNRLDEARRAKPSRYDSLKLAEPAKVKTARARQATAKKVLDDWQKKIDAARARRSKAVDAAFNAAKTAILFSASEKAVKAIEEFERMEFK